MKEYEIHRFVRAATRFPPPVGVVLCASPNRNAVPYQSPGSAKRHPGETAPIPPCEPRGGSIFHAHSMQPLQGWNYPGILFPGWRFADPGLCYETPLAFFQRPLGCPRISSGTVALCMNANSYERYYIIAFRFSCSDLQKPLGRL